MAKTTQISVVAQKVVDFLKSNGNKAYTMAQISKGIGEDVASGTLTGLVNRGLIVKGEMVKPTLLIECECGRTHEIELKGSKLVSTYQIA